MANEVFESPNTTTSIFPPDDIDVERTAETASWSVTNGHRENEQPPADAVFYLVVTYLSVVAVFGTLGNGLAIACIVFKRNLRTNSNVLILSLSTSDFMTCSLLAPLTIVGYVTNGQSFGYPSHGMQGSALCQFYAFLVIQSGATSIFCMTTIALNRYFCICNREVYLKVFTKRHNIIFGLISHLAAVIFSIPPLLGFSEYHFIPAEIICLVKRPHENGLGFMLFLSCFTFVVPLFIILFCYTKICLFIYEKKKIELFVRQRQISISPLPSATVKSNQDFSVSSPYQPEGIRRPDIAITKTVFALFLSCIICLAPYQGMASFYFAELPFGLISLFYTNSAVNAILYNITNQKFRTAQFEILTTLLCCKRQKSKIANFSNNL